MAYSIMLNGLTSAYNGLLRQHQRPRLDVYSHLGRRLPLSPDPMVIGRQRCTPSHLVALSAPEIASCTNTKGRDWVCTPSSANTSLFLPIQWSTAATGVLHRDRWPCQCLQWSLVPTPKATLGRVLPPQPTPPSSS
mmetsp:Transcript_34861/g.64134  ORF Transcript_34861/g.64134 Transcript_34861/m.64134 type:complete len:136 (-) Transcript_34861:468-875(-)